MKVFGALIVALALGTACGVGLVAFELSGDETFIRYTGGPDESSEDALPIAEVVGDKTFNFGVAPVHVTGHHTFLIKNLGNANLELKEGKSTCQCTVGKLTDGIVKPGETTEVVLEWTPKSFALDFKHSAQVLTNDPNQPVISLAVEGTVTADSRVVPLNISLGDFTSSSKRTASFRIYGYLRDDLELKTIEIVPTSHSELFHLTTRPLTSEELVDEANAQSGVAVTITIDPGLPIGTVEQTVRFTTNGKDAEQQEIPINGRVVGDISFLPLKTKFYKTSSVLVIGLVKSQEGADETLHLVVKGPHRDDVKLSIDNETLPEYLNVQVGEPRSLGGGKSILYPLEIGIAKEALPVNHTSDNAVKVTIQSTHPTIKEVIFYVDFAIVQ
ncbi:MAG: DUF1573 domain-containing protein [bacterium]|nr:DUF1573 domain-containing protein [bacterium]